MFSGIVQSMGQVAALQENEGILRLDVETDPHFLEGVVLGASISVDGVCLTVVQVKDCIASFDVIQETQSLTTLTKVKKGDKLNLERSLRMGDEIGGHLLSGHIAATGTIQHIQAQDNNLTLTITCPPSCKRMIFPKGFIAIDGISLTVADTTLHNSFTVHLIPETRARTTLGSKAAGSLVNLELDAQTCAVVYTIERLLVSENDKNTAQN